VAPIAQLTTRLNVEKGLAAPSQEQNDRHVSTCTSTLHTDSQQPTPEDGMDTAHITEILTDPVTLDLVEKQPITQIAYAALNGSPRAVPLGYLLRDGKFLFFTIPTSEKVAALQRDSRIALSIDVYPPPCCLLVRGTAELREDAGVPDEYLEASFRTMPENQRAGFEEQVRALDDSMVRIEVTPTWVRLNDFQRTAPRAVERLVQAKQGGPQR
jgi:nitroimidazol reductase NimA-like FMN-containing flavoprotein (pyridoxamine 5'-phosphate oxidase superfamily)